MEPTMDIFNEYRPELQPEVGNSANPNVFSTEKPSAENVANQQSITSGLPIDTKKSVETEPDVLLAKSLQNKNQQPEQIMEANRQQLDDMIDRLNRKLNTMNREIQFRLDEKIGRNYISVIDRKTKEIIKEFPPEEIRNFIARSIEFSTRAGLDDSALKELLISLEV